MNFSLCLTKIPVYKAATYIFFLITFLFSQWWVPRNNWKEIFPFFHWSLFSEPPHLVHRYNLEVLLVDGEAPSEPCFYNDCHFLKGSPTHMVYYIIQEFGSAIAEKDNHKVDNLRLIIEKQIFRDHQAYKYNLVQEKIEPQKYILNQTVESRAIVATVSSIMPLGK